MVELHADPVVGAWLADADLVVDDAEHKGPGGTEGTLAIGRRVNRIRIGVPQTIDVLGTWPADERLDAEIEAARARSDFLYVRFACSFVPARGCHFEHATLDVALCLDDSDAEPPVAVDLFPRETGTDRTFSRSFGITGGVKLAFAELSVEGRRDGQVLRYDAEVTAAGLLTDSPSWMFDATERRGLAGIKELFLLVKKPKGRLATAQFSASADVRAAWGLRRCSRDRILQSAHPLT